MDIAYLLIDHDHEYLKSIYESRNIKVFAYYIADNNRNELENMLDYIEANKIDKLYVNSIIDLGKSLIESLKLYIKSVSKNIEIISSTEPFLNKDKDLTNIKKNGMKKKSNKRNNNSKAKGKEPNKSKRFRTDINRWPYRLFQELIDYKSNNETVYVNPEGTSTECPVCGGILEHPIWKESKCINCSLTYGRDKLASLSISVRELCLCGTPFTVSGSASWHSMKNNYLYTIQIM
jgi:hypothetical protein